MLCVRESPVAHARRTNRQTPLSSWPRHSPASLGTLVQARAESLNALQALEQFIIRRGSADTQEGAHEIRRAVHGRDVVFFQQRQADNLIRVQFAPPRRGLAETAGDV